MEALEFLGLAAAGLVIGVYAGAIGAGGGFLLAPLLLLRHEDAEPAAITLAALTVVAISSGLQSGIALRDRRVDLPVAGLLAAAAIPAALLGAVSTALLPRSAFAVLFALLLLVVGAYLAWRPVMSAGTVGLDGWRRHFTDGEGSTFYYRVPLRRSLGVTVGAAFLAALAGIGGGLIYTPLTTRVMRMPHWLAVPASHVVIASISAVVVAFHLAAGRADDPLKDAPALAVGVVLALPLARVINRRLGEGLLMRLFAAGLLLVGIRTALVAL